jgi:hypothetical protein
LIPNLFTGEPAWLIIFCLLLAGGYSVGLYFRDRKNEFPLFLRILLASVRFIAVFLITFMLLTPFIRSVSKEKEKPLIIIAVDNSQSIRMNADSLKYRNEFLENLDLMSARLSEAGEIRKYTFGDNLVQLEQNQALPEAVSFGDKITDISGLINELGDLYANRNVGALILASDGIYNAGSNPVYQAKEWAYPLYTIAMGDTSIKMDAIIARVNFNRMVYLNNKFPLEVIVRANEASGKQSRLVVYHEGNQVYAQDFVVDKDDFTHTFQVILEARENGLLKYSIVIDPVEGELSMINNRKEIFVEVLDAKSKALIISGAPHPDISSLTQAISSNLNYEVDEFLLDDFTGDVENYSMVILHQLPSKLQPADELLRIIGQKEVPALFILGTQSDLNRFNQYKSGLSISTGGKTIFEEAIPSINQGFSAFSLGDETRAWFIGLPPLIAPMGDYRVSNSARVLLNQRLGSVETSRPLFLFNETLEGRTGVIAGEGIWKWRLYNFAKFNNHLAFNELVNKMIQYLSLKEQKKNFRVYSQGNFSENEPVVFDAEVYNESYELTTEAEVDITIRNEEGNQFPFNFNKAGNSYHLDAGTFPPGNYTFQAKAGLQSIDYSADGQFSVSAIDLEALSTTADHHLLYQLAKENSGRMYYPDELESLSDHVLAREDIRPVIYTRKKYEDLLNQGWLLAIITCLLTLEWFLRKRAGSY